MIRLYKVERGERGERKYATKKYIFQILHKEIKLASKVLAFADSTNENI